MPEEKKGSPEDEEETLQRKNANPVPWVLYALRPRRRSSGKGNNQLLKPHDNEKKILARSPLDKIPIAAAVSPRPKGAAGAETAPLQLKLRIIARRPTGERLVGSLFFLSGNRVRTASGISQE